MQSIGFYCAISATKYGKVVITTSIQKAKVVVTFMLGIVFLMGSFFLVLGGGTEAVRWLLLSLSIRGC